MGKEYQDKKGFGSKSKEAYKVNYLRLYLYLKSIKKL